MLQYRWESVWRKSLGWYCPSVFMRRTSIICIIRLPALMRTGKFLEFIEKPTSRMTIIIRKNSILHRETAAGTIGVGICWDQWFPETARCMALEGAELLFYPTAIGSEPILECDSMPHWRRCMQGHAASNLIPVIAANRIGVETVEPSAENGGQSSSLNFYGSSFVADETGELLETAARDKEEILVQSFDLDELQQKRLEWGLFRDRRPECYHKITQ